MGFLIVWLFFGALTTAVAGYIKLQGEGALTISDIAPGLLILTFGIVSAFGAVIFGLGHLYEKYGDVVIVKKDSD